MSHYIFVTLPDEGETELDSYLNISGDLSHFYRAFNAEKFDQGTNGDGNTEVSRDDIEKAKLQLQSETSILTFLNDVLDESDSNSFIFHFS